MKTPEYKTHKYKAHKYKTMILAAGFGTRLLPYTGHTPKPLFTINNRPVLDHIIKSLENAGCEAIMVNTHHLHTKIETFIKEQKYNIPVNTCYEPEILGTGGAVKNVSDFWDDRPFMIVNSDVFTNIDFHDVYKFHINHEHPATLVLYDDENFNTVSVSHDNFITSFSNAPDNCTKLTFTGIQVLDPGILEYIPGNEFFSSIDAFKKMMLQGRQIKAYVSNHYSWKDIGTPKSYINTSMEFMGSRAVYDSWPDSGSPIKKTRLKGDGSDRKWYRIQAKGKSFILAEHGIKKDTGTRAEIDAFIDINLHLRNKKIPVPEICQYDRFSGLALMEDLGDVHLESLVNKEKNREQIILIYKNIIDILCPMAVNGLKDFHVSWTFQTETYDKKLILENECGYFTKEFLQNFMGLPLGYEDLEKEFNLLADNTLECGLPGFMHRDMQSRNIMIKNNQFYFIDFQGARLGPVQYDLASLLVDPYVNLPESIQTILVSYYLKILSSYIEIDTDRFLKGLYFCYLTRNLQILGAFSFLSLKKDKGQFKEYIPAALKSLKLNLSKSGGNIFPKLKQTLEKL